MYTLFIFRCHRVLNIYHWICTFFFSSSSSGFFGATSLSSTHSTHSEFFLFILTLGSLVAHRCFALTQSPGRVKKINKSKKKIAGKRTEERLPINIHILYRAYGYHKNYLQCQTIKKVKINRFQWKYENEVDVTKTSTYAQDKQVTNFVFSTTLLLLLLLLYEIDRNRKGEESFNSGW